MEQLKTSAAQFLGHFLFKSFRLFASLRLAISLIVSLMIVLATGTIIESLHGTDAARITIYESPWFSLLLLLLGINVAGAAMDRYPWKKKHTGFVITHLGIIVILIGSFVTQKSMTDGQMILQEGETTHKMTLGKPLLYIFQEDLHRDWVFELRQRAFNWRGKKTILNVQSEETPKPFSVHLRSYYPKAIIEETFAQSASGAPALKIKLQNSFVTESVWLWKDDPTRGKTQMGPATLVFTEAKLKDSAPLESQSKFGYLEIELAGIRHQVQIPEGLKFPQKIKIPGTEIEIEILDFFRNAIVEGTKLVEQVSSEKPSDNPVGNNPALRLFIRSKNNEELHTVFAKYPDFPTMHGMKPSELGVHLQYRLPGGAGSKGQSHELRFVQNTEGLFYQIQTGLKVETKPLKIGEETPLGWMGMNFTVEAFYPHAQIQKNFIPQSPNTKAEHAASAIEIELEQSGKSKSIWLAQGVREPAEFEGAHYLFMFGEKHIPAGFNLTLRDFRMKTDPGTDNPASFESDVTLRDDIRGVVKDVTISMNEPLTYRGWSIYQSGYSLTPGAPEISIFSVGKDPGIPLKYGGTIIMVIGIILMFYFRSYSLTGGKL